jgi:arginine deiminase
VLTKSESIQKSKISDLETSLSNLQSNHSSLIESHKNELSSLESLKSSAESQVSLYIKHNSSFHSDPLINLYIPLYEKLPSKYEFKRRAEGNE